VLKGREFAEVFNADEFDEVPKGREFAEVFKGREFIGVVEMISSTWSTSFFAILALKDLLIVGWSFGTDLP